MNQIPRDVSEQPRQWWPILFALVAMLCLVVALVFAAVSPARQAATVSSFWALQFDKDWAWAHAAHARPLLVALEAYKQRHGTYPESLTDVAPTFLKVLPRPFPHPDGDRKTWWYRRDSEHGYDLLVTALHWISEFDILLYRPVRPYPDWKQHGYDPPPFRWTPQ